MKRFKRFALLREDKKFYLEVDNSYDSSQTAKDAISAVKKLFPNLKSVSFIGSDKENGNYISVYDVKDKNGKPHKVRISEE